MKLYVAIIGDIRDSRNINNRGKTQTKLNKILDDINDRYSGDIAANFIITLGDEFQGLLYDGNYALEIIRMIQRQMHPVEVRFGIGIGSISTKIKRDAAIGADGPAYYAARNMVEELKILEKKLKLQAPDVKIGYYEDKDDLRLEQLNVLFRVNKIIENSWSEDQRKIIIDEIENGDSQAIMAQRHGITQSTVARRLNSGNFKTYEDIEKIINKTMAEISK